MADTTFSPGTGIASTWLNDVNRLTYDIGDSSSTAKGDALVAIKQPFTGSVARTQHDKNKERISVLDFIPANLHAGIFDRTGTVDVSSYIASAIAATDDLYWLPGRYYFNNEVLVDKSIRLNSIPGNEYDSAGVEIYIAHNDANKSAFKVGYTTNNIRFSTTGGFKFTAPVGSNSYAGIRCKAATVYIDTIEGSANVNALSIEDSYIGEVRRLSGPSKTYLLKTAGNVSLGFGVINAGSSSGGLASIQLTNTEGQCVFDRIYLEAQSTGNLSLTNTGNASFIFERVYEENSSLYGIYADASRNIVILNYYTNTNTKTIFVTNGSQVRIDGIVASSRFERYELVSCDSTSVLHVGGVQYSDGFDYGSGDYRDFAMFTGIIAGSPAVPITCNPQLTLSASNTVSTVGGSAVSTDVPGERRMRISDSSITVVSGSRLKVPFTKWRSGAMVVIQIIYKCDSSSETAFSIRWVKNSSDIKTITSINKSTTNDWQMATIVTRNPVTDTLNQYSSLEVRADTGVTMQVHMFGASHYDGGNLPFGFIDDSILLCSQPITLNTLGSTSVIVPGIGGKKYRFHSYELVYETASGAGATGIVGIGDLSAVGALTAYANFTTAANKAVGGMATILAAGGAYPFRDHWNDTTNGWGVQVTTAATHGGTAKVYIRAVPVDTNSDG